RYFGDIKKPASAQENTKEQVPCSFLLDLRGGENADIVPQTLRDLVDETIKADRKRSGVTGGVLSGIGKGVTASSIGVLL
ncbi:hypothetical protein ACS4XJ_23740, partial [Escherichia coli]|uniref:hypothetical protein n=1 Tax=Escherichia coli TaxID=562 RepID=UPI003F42861B